MLHQNYVTFEIVYRIWSHEKGTCENEILVLKKNNYEIVKKNSHILRFLHMAVFTVFNSVQLSSPSKNLSFTTTFYNPQNDENITMITT